MTLRFWANLLANSPFLAPARKLWAANQHNWNLPLSKSEKALVGCYLILHDYANRRFPPTFDDQQRAYDAEIAYRFSLPGLDVAEVTDSLMRKPFGSSAAIRTYLHSFIDLVQLLEQLGVQPPQKLLELGCGTGWMAELLALLRYNVMGTSLSSDDIADARLRIQSLVAKQITPHLEFRVAPMETVNQAVGDQLPFDAVFVFEALHHAYNWRQAIDASHACLTPGGWLIIANEPNAIHTYVSYRVAKLSNTHEIGFRQHELMDYLRRTGFSNVRVSRNRVSFWVKPHWIVGQKRP